ncbi:NAD(P)H-dependent oxidoreductase [Glycomyces endophyticus]|uniref:FMN dependent NADH:quinone oxidoreductase n=1 Tax=Glycomyces endophyticus TaxID=480996 RepID=A0ABP4SIC9_9ACTN
MPELLRIDASYAPNGSVSRELTGVFAKAWRDRGSEYTLVERDLRTDPVPHFAHPALHWHPPLGEAPPADDALREAARVQRSLVDELLAADVLLIGAPMYNYSPPSTLRAWLDHVHVRGLTSAAERDTRPLRGRAAVIVATRGTVHGPGTANEHRDHAIPPLRLILGEEFGMEVTVVAVNRTLSASLPALADERPAFEEERRTAAAHLIELARTVTRHAPQDDRPDTD